MESQSRLGVWPSLGLDFDDVSIFELRLQRHNSAINLGSNTGIADFSMNGIRKVNGGGIPRQNDNFALGREGIDLFGIKVDFQRVQEVAWILHFLLPFHQMSQPKEALIVFFVQTTIPSCTSSELQCLLQQLGAFPWFEFELQTVGRADQSLRCEAIGTYWAAEWR